MSIQRTAAPGGVANLLCFQFLPVGAGDEGQRPSLGTPEEHRFWTQLIGSPAETDWPAVTGAKVRLGSMAGGCIFTIEDERGLLVIGGVGKNGPSLSWIHLLKTVRQVRSAGRESVGRAEGGTELLTRWEEQPAPAAEGPWLAVVPMMGLRYYTPDAGRILQLAEQIGAGLLAIANRGSLFPKEAAQQDI